MKRGGAHGFTLGKKHLTLYWGGYSYPVDIRWASTPAGLYEMLRHVNGKDWGIDLSDVHAVIRAMGKRFDWPRAEVLALLHHGTFSYYEDNGAGGTRRYEYAWVDQ